MCILLGALGNEFNLCCKGRECKKRLISKDTMKDGLLYDTKTNVVAALLAVGVVNFMLYLRRQKPKQKRPTYENITPKLVHSEGGALIAIETFGDYVVQQMGLDADTPAARRLAKVAEDYLRGDKSKSDDSLENLFIFLSRVCTSMTDDEIEHLNLQLVKELDVCMLTYFSFHWEHTGRIIDQVINGETKQKMSLKKAVLSATRKQRYQRVIKDLKTKRWFSSTLEMMKAMGRHNPSIPQEGSVLVPADSAHRSPVLLLIGGGMGAGKSTVVKEIMQGPFWSGVAHEAVIVEADNFKEKDVIYRALSSIGAGDHISEAAELVHQSSTNFASALLVAALNEGKDVILDGTMSWEPFVLQTIAMARDVHNTPYCMGVGYRENLDGSITEKYWEPVDEGKSEKEPHNASKPERKPYRIEFVGVTCDAHMAVMRGMRRAIITRRGVPVKGQLRSHKLFAKSLQKYCDLVDHVKIFSTSQMGGPGELIALKDGKHNLLTDAKAFPGVANLETLNERATSVLELYSTLPNHVAQDKAIESWTSIVQSEERISRQQLLATQLRDAHLHHDLSEWDLTSLASSSMSSNSSQGSFSSLPSSNRLESSSEHGSFSNTPSLDRLESTAEHTNDVGSNASDLTNEEKE